MQDAAKILAGNISTAGTIDRVQFTSIMAKATTDSRRTKGHVQPDVAANSRTEGHHDSVSASRDLTGSQFTLRIKPDRRRTQMPIPAERERRRLR